MTAEVWPYPPRTEVIEALEWYTDVLASRGEEQRIALREAPRRTFQLTHVLNDYEAAGARALIRSAQGSDGFYVPDWPQAISIGALEPDSQPYITVDLSETDMGDDALIWDSVDNFERVTVTEDSNGVSLDNITNTYTRAYLIPLWLAYAPAGLSGDRRAGHLTRAIKNHELSIDFVVRENNYLGSSSYPQYRDLDVLTDCPKIAGESFTETIGWQLSGFDNTQSLPEYIRKRTIPEVSFIMRWHEFTKSDKWALRQWLHSRYGKQKAFWLSSFAKDFEPAASVSGTTLTTYALPGVDGIGHTTAFDIEVKNKNGDSNYRRVTTATSGTPIGDRATLDLTLDSTLTIALDDIQRISFLRCARFNSDRIELLHQASAGMSAQVPCLEVIEP